MAKMWQEDRLPWETVGGPEVGKDVSITNEPRKELAPGEPAPGREDAADDSSEGSGTEEREVRAADPDLSPETNRRVTAELQEAVGAERVEVPVDRPRTTRGERRPRQEAGAYLTQHRLQLVRSAAIVLTFAGIVSLATGYWWLLGVAAGLHALGTMTVTLIAVRMTTISEHPSSTLAAAMSEEGVSSPDERFSEMVEEFRKGRDAGASEVLSPGHNERTVEASDNPAEAAAEQSSAMTPTAEPSEPAGQGSDADLVSGASKIRLTRARLTAIVAGIALAVAGFCTWLALFIAH
jgi:hypothetical protein